MNDVGTIHDPIGRPVTPAPQEGLDGFLLAGLVRERMAPVVFVARDGDRIEAMRAALSFFAPDLPILEFPAWDCLPYDRISPKPAVSAERMAILSMLADGVKGPLVFLMSVASLCQLVPDRKTVKTSRLAAETGRPIELSSLFSYFDRMGFSRAPTVTEPGDFAIRGGIVDVFPPGSRKPVRLDLFGDVVDSIRLFDPETQRSAGTLSRVDLFPVSEVFVDAESISRFRRNYRLQFGVPKTGDTHYGTVSEGRRFQGLEHWLPFFHERLESILDHLPETPICLDDRLAEAIENRWQVVNSQYDARLAASKGDSGLETRYNPCPPEKLYVSPDRIPEIFEGRNVLTLTLSAESARPDNGSQTTISSIGRPGRNFAHERQAEGAGLFSALAKHVRSRRSEGHVVLACHSEGSRERMADTLSEQGLTNLVIIDSWQELPAGGKSVALSAWALERGFEAPGLTVISEQDILGDRLVRVSRRRGRKRVASFLAEARSYSDGDLVVHAEHGVGKFRCLVVIDIDGAPHECLELEYARGDKLYLPVENLDLLGRYGQNDAQLDRLGSVAWQRRKAGTRNRIRDLAERLLKVAAEREAHAAPTVDRDPDGWNRFCARFPYPETDDQLDAVEAVLSDLSSGRPMDRLICGDVGFGKTEVAVRSAFAVASAGLQVAIICPTTLLVRQHFETFRERFRGTAITVHSLSRLVQASEAERTRDAIADGTADIVIGSHALFSKDVRFKRLGLLVIDEEQHFGVAQKERLKQLRSSVHVMALSATPIPRTLQMSFAGIRDISLISTPPPDRLAVRTYFSSFDIVTAREALLREHYRGGQSFIIVPRISDMPAMRRFVGDHVPEVSLVEAHGRLAGRELDERMNAFYNGEHDVLLATTIATSGLDIPAANTMIVYRPEVFGLAQLYQIRGRVGRSRVRAYAYFMTRRDVRLRPQAEKRIRIMSSLDSLGAGLSLASQDLDMRGAGNLLGEEQSGDIREVGVELYRAMLEETLTRLRSGDPEPEEELDIGWQPVIRLAVPVLIPEDYVPDDELRMGLYKRMSMLRGRTEIDGFGAELIDRFGGLPSEVRMLLRIVRIKDLCRQAGIESFDAGKRGTVIRFRGGRFDNPVGLVDYIKRQNGLATLRNDRLTIRRDWSDDERRVKGALIVSRDLARVAEGGSARTPEGSPSL